MTHRDSIIVLMLLALATILSCQSPQPKSFNTTLTGDDSMSIKIGNSQMQEYRSEQLGLIIRLPSFLVHSENSGEGLEMFVSEGVSILVGTDSITGDSRSPGQQLMAMGAELVTATDDYSIHTGEDEDFEYYSKVIDDSTRFVTVLLRYRPAYEEAVLPLRELVDSFKLEPLHPTRQ